MSVNRPSPGTDQDYYDQAQEVGARIRTARTAAGMSASELAVAVGCSANTIKVIESGRQLPLPPRAMKIMQVLGMEEGYYWQGR